MHELPPEAGNADELPFEPNDEWLSEAAPELQKEAMRRWFLDRYEDPANETPWDGEDKSYVFIWGGPYDPNSEIQDRFGDVVPHEVMYELAMELYREVGHEWAPIHHEGADYESYVSHLIVANRDDPRRFLQERVDEIFSVLGEAEVHGANRRLLHQMAHSSLIAALEAYLADTVNYWTDNDAHVLRRFVVTNKDFQGRSLSLAEVFDRVDGIKEEVKTYLADFIWHRLDKVKPMLRSSLEVDVPDIGPLMREVLVRHDIVHRAGRTATGELVDLSAGDLERVRDAIRAFSDALETNLTVRFAPTPVDNQPF